jgi:hypothetical protein
MDQFNELYVPDSPSDPNERKLSWSLLLTTTYRIYYERFWKFFLMAVPMVLINYLFQQAHLNRLLLRQLLQSHWIDPRHTFMVMAPLSFLGDGFYWLTSAFFFGAVASNVLEVHQMKGLAISDAYSAVRDRVRPVLTAGMIAWTIFFIGRVVSYSALFKLSMRMGQKYWIGIFIILVPLWIVSGLVARLGLTIPELLENPQLSIAGAVRSSIKKTENWEPFFMAFLAKSAILGYVIYSLAGRLLPRLLNLTTISDSTYYWITWIFYNFLAAVLESPLFIAFSVLYRDREAKHESSQAAISGY